MGTRIYGIGAAQAPDNAGETIILDGIVDVKLNGIRDEHSENDFLHRIGAITFHKKIRTERDCENDKQLRCWRFAKVPFLYAEGELADDTGHVDAVATAQMLKFTQRPDIPLEIGFSVDGGIIERRDSSGMVTEDREQGKTLTRTLALDLALTVNPCNPKCKVFLENDLTKSDLSTIKEPTRYKELLQKSQQTSSITDVTEYLLVSELEKLKKSLDSYFTAFTDLSCPKCKKGVRFFKSTSDVPHRCSNCNSNFSMLNIWNALNK